MPSGSAVIRYQGRRGVVWRIKYRDANGRQIQETLGRGSEGWNNKKAQAQLRARLVAVERDGYIKPETTSFATVAATWLRNYAATKALKRTTQRGYEQIVNNHLEPAFGTLQPADVTVERIERYVARKLRHGFSPASVNRQLNVLSLVMRAAVKQRLVNTNPLPLVDRPREPRRRWKILTPAETLRVERALDHLVSEAETDRDREDRQAVLAMFVTLMGTGIRRGELLGLRWHSVLLADPDGAVLRVEETWVKNGADTPKSQAGHRTIALGARVADALFEHRARTKYGSDEDRVFANPRTGRPFDDERYAEILRLALTKAGIDEYVRPCHDLRHSSITNAAAAGTSPEALMSRAGHSSYTTTRRYIDLAGEHFREDADRLERRLWGESGTNSRYKIEADSPAEAGAAATESA